MSDENSGPGNISSSDMSGGEINADRIVTGLVGGDLVGSGDKAVKPVSSASAYVTDRGGPGSAESRSKSGTFR